MHHDRVLNKAKTRRTKQCFRCSGQKEESNKKTTQRKREEREEAAQLQPNILSPLRVSAEIKSIASVILSSTFLGQYDGTPASILIFASRRV
jgi:hypothetical protein